MALIKPFRALRPPRDLAEKVAALPYDVMNTEEAREMAEGNAVSFLHVSRPEIDLPADVDPHDESVYVRGMENLQRFVDNGTLTQDKEECYYIYRQEMGGIVQTGLVVCTAVTDYETGVIKKHELTRADKEEDRVRHIDCLDANDEPVFLTCRNQPSLQALVSDATSGHPEYHFSTDDGVIHTLWIVGDRERVASLTSLFHTVPALYVADGHHRSAAASRVKELRKQASHSHSGREEYNFFMAVIFPDIEMNIMPYNRVVKDLNGNSVAELIAKIAPRFEMTPAHAAVQPGTRHMFGMFLAGRWYELVPKEGSFDQDDAVAVLDVSILQDNLLSPVLGIRNPRTDQRIHFVGGIRGLEELERLVNSGEYAIAFALFPTSIKELMELADAGRIMPPKSTWFEPKLRSGLFVHLLR